MTPPQLPSLSSEHRPAQARRLWRTLVGQTTADTPVVSLGRALALHRLHPPLPIADRMSDLGYLLDLSLQQVVSELWPSIALARGSRYDLEVPEERHSYGFRQKLSAYLRGTANVICVRPGNAVHTSRWWVRTEWAECTPARFTLSTFSPDEPDIPEAELIRLRQENERLRQRNEKLARQVDRITATLRAISDR